MIIILCNFNKNIGNNDLKNKIVSQEKVNNDSLLDYGYKLLDNKINFNIYGYINGIPYTDIENNQLYNISNIIQIGNFNGLKFIINSNKNYINVYCTDNKQSNIINELKNNKEINVLGIIYNKWYLISFGKNKYTAKEGFVLAKNIKIFYEKS